MTDKLEPLVPDEPWCREIISVVDLLPDESPDCRCGEPASYLAGRGMRGKPHPRFLCRSCAEAFRERYGLELG